MNGGRPSRKDSFNLRLPRRCNAADLPAMGFNSRISKHASGLLSNSPVVVFKPPLEQTRLGRVFCDKPAWKQRIAVPEIEHRQAPEKRDHA